MKQIDHIVIAVSSLESARASFTRAGFQVALGGRHEELSTENALVAFADGSYLELLAARDPAAREEWRALAAGPGWARHLRGVSAIARRFLPSLAGADGVADWCLRSAGLRADATRLRACGQPAAGPVAMARERPDGERLAWSLLLPESRVFPFWIEDRTPRERRIPAMHSPHPNGARGIAAVRLRAPGVPMSALALGDVLGMLPASDAVGATRLEADGWTIEIEEGDAKGADRVSVRGCDELPDSIRAMGVIAAEA